MDRQKAIDYIEGQVGCYTAIWHEWLLEDIRKLYAYVCVADHGDVTDEDIRRVGIDN